MLLVIGTAWTLLSLPVALAVGRVIRVADRREETAGLTAVPAVILPSDLGARTMAGH
jgi:hypothetical protein